MLFLLVEPQNESLKGAAALFQNLCLPVASTDFSVTCFGPRLFMEKVKRIQERPGVSQECDGIVGVSCAASGVGLNPRGSFPVQDILWSKVLAGCRRLLRGNQGPEHFQEVYIKLPFYQIRLKNKTWFCIQEDKTLLGLRGSQSS